jgi:hypothetical protein
MDVAGKKLGLMLSTEPGHPNLETGLGFDVTVSQDPSKWLHETTGEAAKARRWVDERMT